MQSFFWTDSIIAHLAEHGVTPEEYEEAFECIVWRELSDSSGLDTLVAFCPRTILARDLDVLPNGQILPVTAYDNEEWFDG